MRRALILAALAAIAATAAAGAQTPGERLAARRCASMPDDATRQACLERVGRTIRTFQSAERGSR